MKLNANEVRVGNVIEHNGALWRIIKLVHTKPGKGGAYLQAELRGVRTETKTNERFRVAEKLEVVHTEEQEYQFLYADDSSLHFMEPESYQLLELDRELAENELSYMTENLKVKIQLCNGSPIGVTLPDKVELVVEEAEAAVKKQTASSSYKPAVMTTGLQVMVPCHVNSGDRLLVATKDGSYHKKVE